MAIEGVVGIEVHAQLLTKSKMFCSCPNTVGAPPNTQVCPICTGMPGVLPVPNRRAVELVIRTGVALNCKIADYSIFARKNYFYPDLPKNYQISQYEIPLCRDGYIEIEVNGETRRIGIRRVHLEEDTGKSFHTGGSESRIDFNRCGVPLMEIVSEPDMRNGEEAREYLHALRQILRYIGVSTGNMEEGSFRCEPNVNVRDTETGRATAIVELKNLNSFRSVYQSINYEIERQKKLLLAGVQTQRETRRWHEGEGTTSPMRSKEEAHDYRYFPEPDLVPLVVDEKWLEEILADMPELPRQKRERLMAQYGLSAYDAGVLCQSVEFADYFEALAAEYGDPKGASNWMQGEVSRLLNETGKNITEMPLQPKQVAELLKMIDSRKITRPVAKEVFEEMFHTGRSAGEIVAERGLQTISDQSELERMVEEAIANNPKAVEEYRGGKQGSINFLVGQVMKASRGKADPRTVKELLAQKLSS